MKNNVIIYQAKNGEIKLKGDFANETIWASQADIAKIFGVTPQNITIHLRNIFEEKELEKKSTCKESLQVQLEGKREIKRKILEYNLDILIAIGYRINSVTGTKFRKWATRVLKQHITAGYSINKTLIGKNYSKFIKAIENVRNLLPDGNIIDNESVLELVKFFANTWLSLDAYDKSQLPTTGINQKQVSFVSDDLNKALAELKIDLIKKDEATDLFAIERENCWTYSINAEKLIYKTYI